MKTIPRSKYFKSVKLKPLSEREEHIQLDAKAIVESVRDNFFDWLGRAKDTEIQDLCSLYAGADMRGGKANGRQTPLQRMFDHAIKEMKLEGRFVNEK